MSVMTVPVATSRAAKRSPVHALVVVGGRAGVLGNMGKVGAVRLSAWIWGFSSMAKTAAATGGLM